MAFLRFVISIVGIVSVIISVVVVIDVVSVVISRESIVGGSSRAPQWKQSPGFWMFWQWRAGVEEAVDQLTPVFFVRGFMDPIL